MNNSWKLRGIDAALKLYPKAFREQFGEDMRQALRDEAGSLSGGGWIRVMGNLMVGAVWAYAHPMKYKAQANLAVEGGGALVDMPTVRPAILAQAGLGEFVHAFSWCILLQGAMMGLGFCLWNASLWGSASYLLAGVACACGWAAYSQWEHILSLGEQSVELRNTHLVGMAIGFASATLLFFQLVQNGAMALEHAKSISSMDFLLQDFDPDAGVMSHRILSLGVLFLLATTPLAFICVKGHSYTTRVKLFWGMAGMGLGATFSFSPLFEGWLGLWDGMAWGGGIVLAAFFVSELMHSYTPSRAVVNPLGQAVCAGAISIAVGMILAMYVDGNTLQTQWKRLGFERATPTTRDDFIQYSQALDHSIANNQPEVFWAAVEHLEQHRVRDAWWSFLSNNTPRGIGAMQWCIARTKAVHEDPTQCTAIAHPQVRLTGAAQARLMEAQWPWIAGKAAE